MKMTVIPVITGALGTDMKGLELGQKDFEIRGWVETIHNIAMLWGMQSTPLFLTLPGLLWPGVVVPGRILSMGQIQLLR